MNSAELRKAGFNQTADAVELFEIVEQEHRNLERKYNALIMAVVRAFPDETRHATALRYINEAERSALGAGDGSADASPPPDGLPSAGKCARVET